jgi:hypothetical protein
MGRARLHLPATDFRPSEPKLCPSRDRGRRESRVPNRTRGPVCKNKKAHKRSHHRFVRINRLSPRDGFNGFLRALPGDRALLPPSPRNAKHCRELTTASGCQDDTTSPSASRRLVFAPHCVHRIPRPTFVTTAKRPSLRSAGRPRLVALICPTSQGDFFDGDAGQTGFAGSRLLVICPTGKSVLMEIRAIAWQLLPRDA